MMIAARNAFLMGGAKPWPNPYVTDGLVAMWDGKWNAGWGQHDPEATVWKDLVGNCDLTRRGTPAVKPLCMFFDGSCCFYGSAQLGPISTLENVVDAKTQVGTADPVLVQLNGSSEYKIHINANTLSAGISYVGVVNNVWPGINTGIHGVAWVFDKSPQILYLSGARCGTWSVNRPETVTSIGIGAANDSIFRPGVGDLYCVRLYSRALTAAEIAANYAVDAARFGI